MLTDSQQDVLCELINIGVGRAAGALNQMLNHHIVLQVPVLKLLTTQELRQETQAWADTHLAIVRLRFRGSLSGSASLVFPPESASQLVGIMINEDGEPPDGLDAIRIGTLTEVGNIVINGVMGSISNALHEHLSYLLPTFLEGSIDSVWTSFESAISDSVLYAQANFLVKQLEIQGSIILLFEVGSFDILIERIDRLLAEL